MNDAGFAIWLYGSHVRGDADPYSDLDVLIIGEPSPSEVSRFLDGLGPNLAISRYRWHEIEEMVIYGSLFLHHLRLEGRLLLESAGASGRLSALLQNLGSYIRAERDLRAFETVINDIQCAPPEITTPLFEMSVLATVLRHSSVLGCYVCGQPKFGRVEPFRFLIQRWSLPPELSEEFVTLYQFRLNEEGRCPPPFLPRTEDVALWASFARRFLNHLGEEVNEYQRGLLATYRKG